MSEVEARNEQRLRRYVREVWEEGNLDAIEDYVTPEYVEHNLSDHNPDIEGIEDHRRNVEQFRTAFPDLSLEFVRIVTDGDRTAQLFRCRGTHDGEFLGLPPTGESIEITAVGITEWDDGMMVEDWSQVDTFSLFQQLGVDPGTAMGD